MSVDKEEALAAFANPPATKLLYVFRECVWTPPAVWVARVGLVSLWYAASPLDNGPVVMVGQVAAAVAQELDGLGAAEALQRGLGDLAEVLGVGVVTLQVLLAIHCLQPKKNA